MTVSLLDFDARARSASASLSFFRGARGRSVTGVFCSAEHGAADLKKEEMPPGEQLRLESWSPMFRGHGSSSNPLRPDPQLRRPLLCFSDDLQPLRLRRCWVRLEDCRFFLVSGPESSRGAERKGTGGTATREGRGDDDHLENKDEDASAAGDGDADFTRDDSTHSFRLWKNLHLLLSCRDVVCESGQLMQGLLEHSTGVFEFHRPAELPFSLQVFFFSRAFTREEPGSSRTSICRYRGRALASLRRLENHKRTHKQPVLLRCSKCTETFSSPQEKEVHVRTHREEERFSCRVCEKVLSSRAALKVHGMVHSKVKTRFQCSDCDKTFSTRGNLQSHRLLHAEPGEFRCEQCSKSFSQVSYLKKHSRKHSGRTSWTCDVCGRQLSSSDSLSDHKKIHSGEKPHVCSDCGASFRLRAFLIRHQRSHSGEKPFLCSDCGKSFSDHSHFRVHQRTHSGSRPHQCPDCGRSFVQRTNLTQHRRIHSGEKPFSCSVCAKAFARSDALKTHQRTHSRENLETAEGQPTVSTRPDFPAVFTPEIH
ncbi:hypothetical protein DNTS_030212 [Danionella cerebrum]|uniref:C2H2-type domain-containing protein n=1 Tax=Danionella cerebrum TaxID=2873325 RepID=A0A553Q8A0_9TELE|nr:hypothetical protein DNTS_030212 [Danionella translucida]